MKISSCISFFIILKRWEVSKSSEPLLWCRLPQSPMVLIVQAAVADCSPPGQVQLFPLPPQLHRSFLILNTEMHHSLCLGVMSPAVQKSSQNKPQGLPWQQRSPGTCHQWQLCQPYTVNAKAHFAAFTQISMSYLGVCGHVCDGDCWQNFGTTGFQSVTILRGTFNKNESQTVIFASKGELIWTSALSPHILTALEMSSTQTNCLIPAMK